MSSVTSGSTAGGGRDRDRRGRPREAARDETRDRRVLLVWLAAIGVGVLALGASLWRLMPGVGFWDTAEFQMVGPVMGTAHPTGYPTYVLVGWLASVLLQPLGEAALRMNVLSAILVAVGAAFSVDLARRLSGSIALGVAAGHRDRADPDRLGRRDPRRSARPPLRPARDHPLAAGPLGGGPARQRRSTPDVRPAANPRTADRLLDRRRGRRPGWRSATTR